MSLKIFKLTHPLAPGMMLVEASAGTGKTYSISTTAVRLIGEKNIKVDEILVVTFTNDAAAAIT